MVLLASRTPVYVIYDRKYAEPLPDNGHVYHHEQTHIFKDTHMLKQLKPNTGQPYKKPSCR